MREMMSEVFTVLSAVSSIASYFAFTSSERALMADCMSVMVPLYREATLGALVLTSSLAASRVACTVAISAVRRV